MVLDGVFGTVFLYRSERDISQAERRLGPRNSQPVPALSNKAQQTDKKSVKISKLKEESSEFN